MAHPLATVPEIEVRRSLPKTVAFLAVTVAFAIGLVLTVVCFEQIRDDAMTYTGRRSTFRALIAPGLVVLALVLTALFAWTTIASGSTARLRSTGAVLRGTRRTIAGDIAVADVLHHRLSTRDARVYAPIPFHDRGGIELLVYRARAQRIGYVALRARGRRGHAWPILDFHGDGADALLRAIGEHVPTDALRD